MTRNKFFGIARYLLYLVAVSAIGVELIGRTLWVCDGKNIYWKNRQLFVFDRELNYSLKPGFKINGEDNRLYPGVGVQINSIGLRANELDGRPKIAVVGDSVVFGYGVDVRSAMSTRLEQLLGGKFQVVNGGVPGYNFEQTQLMAERLENKIHPLAVVVLVNANDLQPRYYLSHGGATLSRFRAYPWEDSLLEERAVTHDTNDGWILSAVYNRGRLIELPKSPQKNPQDLPGLLASERKIIEFMNTDAAEVVRKRDQAIASTREFVDRMQSAGVKVAFALFPWRVLVEDSTTKDLQLSRWWSQIPESQVTAKIDLTPILREAGKSRQQFLIADDHPSEFGHNTIARELAVVMNRMLN